MADGILVAACFAGLRLRMEVSLGSAEMRVLSSCDDGLAEEDDDDEDEMDDDVDDVCMATVPVLFVGLLLVDDVVATAASCRF